MSNRLSDWWFRGRNERGRGISLLVPYRSDHGRREESWEWLHAFWNHHLPEAQLIVGHDDQCDPDDGVPFSKARAVNEAAERARGDIFVILDADCFIRPEVVLDCARSIRLYRKWDDFPLWYMPYRRFYRLTDEFSRFIMSSDPEHPSYPPNPPKRWMLDVTPEKSSNAHWFGALIQIMPREAFELVGGMDERFRSWGGEDVSFMRAVDALYGRHRTTDNPVWHLWHPTFGGSGGHRFWEGGDPHANDWLADRYTRCIGDPLRMRHLVDEPKDQT